MNVFAVRNSGITAVVEGLGTTMVVNTWLVAKFLYSGKIGRNFAAGMSGGYAYILSIAMNAM